MKKRNRVFRLVAKIVLVFLSILVFLSLIGCKTQTKIERSTQLDSIFVREIHTISYDSLMQQILTTLTFNYEYTLIDWSPPDESGNQYKEKETNIKIEGKQETESNTTRVREEAIIERDSTDVRIVDNEIITPVETKTWWDKIRIKIGNIGIIIILGAVAIGVIWLIKKFR